MINFTSLGAELNVQLQDSHLYHLLRSFELSDKEMFAEGLPNITD